VDDRIALEVGPVGVAGLPDREILEQVGEVFVPLLEPGPQHRQIERFAEAPGPGEKRDLDTWTIEELPDHVRLVDVLEAELADGAEVVDADGDTVNHETRLQALVATPWRRNSRGQRVGIVPRGPIRGGGANGRKAVATGPDRHPPNRPRTLGKTQISSASRISDAR